MKYKKILISVIAVVTIFLSFMAVSPKIFLKSEQKSYPVGTTSIDVVLYNFDLSKQYHCSRYQYVLEKLCDGEWKRMEKDEKGAFFPDDMFFPGLRSELTFDMTKYCDALSEGSYRIVMTLYHSQKGPTEIVCEFEVEEGALKPE